jgi:uncharacterized membrane protein (UPF0127 family)
MALLRRSAILAVVLVVGACSSDDASLRPSLDTGQVQGFEVVEMTIDGERRLVALADTPSLRFQGLRGVDDLGDLAGMWFSWGGSEATSAFTMQDTLIPLDIAFFDSRGRVVDVLTMVPCEQTDCPLYRASAPYVAALEVPAGGPVDLDLETVVSPVP